MNLQVQVFRKDDSTKAEFRTGENSKTNRHAVSHVPSSVSAGLLAPSPRHFCPSASTTADVVRQAPAPSPLRFHGHLPASRSPAAHLLTITGKLLLDSLRPKTANFARSLRLTQHAANMREAIIPLSRQGWTGSFFTAKDTCSACVDCSGIEGSIFFVMPY